jgi:hypothetical protein
MTAAVVAGKEEGEQEKCVVCLAPELDKPSGLDGCAHLFCESCIRNWAKKSCNQCPVCRADFSRIRRVGGGRRSIGVKPKRQRVRYEDTGMGMVDPFLRNQEPAGIHGRSDDPTFSPQDQQWMTDDLFFDGGEAGRAAYRRQSLEQALMAAVYGHINRERQGHRVRRIDTGRIRGDTGSQRAQSVSLRGSPPPPPRAGEFSNPRLRPRRIVAPDVIELLDSEDERPSVEIPASGRRRRRVEEVRGGSQDQGIVDLDPPPSSSSSSSSSSLLPKSCIHRRRREVSHPEIPIDLTVDEEPLPQRVPYTSPFVLKDCDSYTTHREGLILSLEYAIVDSPPPI